jgi:hypothetical protein
MVSGMQETETESKHTAVAAITEEHFLASVVLVAYFARELRQENA